ncbi:hypothetical protein ACFSHQ_24050 [Gemmobacter lanyuensis]
MASRDPRVTGLRLVTSAAMLSRLEPYLLDTAVETETIAPERLTDMTSGSLLCRGRAQWQAARHLARDSAVFLPFFDHAVVAAAIDPVPIARDARISGVIFRPPNRHGLPVTAKSRLDAARRWTTYALARRVTRGPLFTLDELVAAKAAPVKAVPLCSCPIRPRIWPCSTASTHESAVTGGRSRWFSGR